MSPVRVSYESANHSRSLQCDGEKVLAHSCVGTNPFHPTAVAVTRSKLLLSVSNDGERRSRILPRAFSDTAVGKAEDTACSMVGDVRAGNEGVPSTCPAASCWGWSRGITRISVRLSTDCWLLEIPRAFSRSSILCFSLCAWSYSSSSALLFPLVSWDCSSFARCIRRTSRRPLASVKVPRSSKVLCVLNKT